MYNKIGKCWLCGKKRDLTEHHKIPKVLGLKSEKVLICRPCHNKIHLLLPIFNPDGSYRWKGSNKIYGR